MSKTMRAFFLMNCLIVLSLIGGAVFYTATLAGVLLRDLTGEATLHWGSLVIHAIGVSFFWCLASFWLIITTITNPKLHDATRTPERSPKPKLRAIPTPKHVN